MEDAVHIFARPRCYSHSAQPVLFRRINRSGRLLCNICLQVDLFLLGMAAVGGRLGGPAENAASLFFDRKPCKQSREKQHTVFRNALQKKNNYFWVVTPCYLTDALYIFWDPEDRLSGFITNTVTVSPPHYTAPHFRTHYSKHSRQ